MNIPKKVKQTIEKQKLIGKREKVLVALSGGKDSTLVAFLLHKLGHNIEGFHINLGLGKYSSDCEKAVEQLCKDLGIKLHIHNFKEHHGSSMCYLRTSIQSIPGKKGLKNCAICGVIKKWILNREARKLGFKKIATGHNLDDEAQTFLLNILKGAPSLSANTGAITKNGGDKKFVTRIKPLFYIPEKEIRKFTKKRKLPIHYEACPCALDSYRIQLRKFLNTIPDKDKQNIIKNFERIHPILEKKKKKGAVNYCGVCGEPCRDKICKRCSLMNSKH